MADNPDKKKKDGKQISKQEHEQTYQEQKEKKVSGKSSSAKAEPSSGSAKNSK